MARAITADDIVGYLHSTPPEKRGLNVYSTSDILNITGKTRQGTVIQGEYQEPVFALSIQERIEIARRSDIILGIVTSRMNRIRTLEWNVINARKDEERLASMLEMYHDIFHEYDDLADDPKVATARNLIVQKLKKHLPDLRPDLENFGKSLARWRKRVRAINNDRSTEVEDWIKQPNLGMSFDEWTASMVFDLMIHGAAANYKQYQQGQLDAWYLLPGGGVMPLRSKHVGGPTAYFQWTEYSTHANIYFGDEMSYARYIPQSAQAYGLVPLEALINKVAESLLFDRLAAEQADGTKPPEKVVLFGDKNPFGDMDAGMSSGESGGIPMDEEEQKRLETVVNEERQWAIRILSGYGSPQVLDLSRSETFQYQSERQRLLRESAALAFNATNLEVNLTSSEGSSGRATTESQERLDQKRGLGPMLKVVEDTLNREIIPFRFGWGYQFQYASGMSESEQWDLIKKKVSTGVLSVNELRTDELGLEPYPEDDWDRPQQQQEEQQGSEPQNPLFTNPME